MSSMVSPCESGKEQDMKLVVPEGDGGVERFHTRVHLGFSRTISDCLACRLLGASLQQSGTYLFECYSTGEGLHAPAEGAGSWL
jgi:hypothetical protein